MAASWRRDRPRRVRDPGRRRRRRRRKRRRRRSPPRTPGARPAPRKSPLRRVRVDAFAAVILGLLAVAIVAVACVLPYQGLRDADGDGHRWQVTLARWSIARDYPVVSSLAGYAERAERGGGIEAYLPEADTTNEVLFLGAGAGVCAGRYRRLGRAGSGRYRRGGGERGYRRDGSELVGRIGGSAVS